MTQMQANQRQCGTGRWAHPGRRFAGLGGTLPYDAQTDCEGRLQLCGLASLPESRHFPLRRFSCCCPLPHAHNAVSSLSPLNSACTCPTSTKFFDLCLCLTCLGLVPHPQRCLTFSSPWPFPTSTKLFDLYIFSRALGLAPTHTKLFDLFNRLPPLDVPHTHKTL
jgi:hypothetical protein